jgi:hypothetical protein
MMTMISTTTSATIPTIGANVKGRRQRRLIIIITLFVSFVLLLAGVGLSFTSSSPLSPFAFGKEEAKIKGLLGADDAGFLNPDEEESTKVSVEDEVEVHGKNEEEEEEEEEEENATGELLGVGDQEEEVRNKNNEEDDEENINRDEAESEEAVPPKTKKTTTTTMFSRHASHSHACSPEYIALFPPKAKANKATTVSTLAHRKNYENTGAYRDKKIPASILPNSGRDILAAPAVVATNSVAANGDAPWRTCALVGNSGHLLKMDYGKQIDANDVVVRINQAPTKGYEKFVGKKTTHRLLNRLWTIAYHDGSGINKIYRGGGWPLEKGVTLISSRTAAENFVRLAYYVKNKLKRKDVQTLFLMPEIRAVAENSLKKFRKCYEKKHSKNFKGGNCASSGLVGIAMLRPLCVNITVYGLGKGQRGDPYQYYRLKQTHRSYGNPVHSFDTEDIMFRTMANDGVINFCNAKEECRFNYY